ncbi:cysteine peptidase family C39 domain-containing protein [Scytonema sp. NUACC26]|uniref:cysteine peptidase family C39 domain-containing protein n=1 Tax=Scytonema sp. NUACC26 TaxID=3140176 RepID=UPI0034DCB16F
MKYPHVLQQSEEDCGAACLASIAKYYGRTFTLNHIREVVGTGQLGTTLLGLRRGAETLGFNARPVKTSREMLNKINNAPLPAIIHWKGNHWVVQSAHARTLVRIRPDIDTHKGGFTVADKSLSSKEMLIRVDWALQGLTHTKDIKGIHGGLEIKPEWLKVLTLAFEQGLQDKALAEKMCVSERMVRHYWNKLQDALNVYPEEGKNIRIQTEMRAREEGLID